MYYEKYLNLLETSSGWATDEGLAASKGCVRGCWTGPHREGGVVLFNRGNELVADGGQECRHVLIIGATGTGKSRLVIMPSLLYSIQAEEKRSYVVFDVKGELEAATRPLALHRGYQIRRIDFRSPGQGDRWSPFVKINRLYRQGGRSRAKAVKLLEDLIASIFNDGQGTRVDPFWRNISASVFRGVCHALWETDQDLTLGMVTKLIQSIPVDRDDDRDSDLFQLVNRLPRNSIAKRNLEGFRSGSNTTRGNVLACFNTYMSPLTARDDILEMMSTNESVDFQALGLTPTVLYISLPDDSTALGALQCLLLTQLMQDLNECALRNAGLLPVRTDVYLDEICNIHPAIPGLETALTIGRSRGIRYVLAIQSYSQLAGVYGPAAETISANCSTWIALNIAKDETFRAKLSQLCGKNPLGEPLITPAQLSLLQYEQGIVIRERCAPYFAQFEDLSRVIDRMPEEDRPLPAPPEPAPDGEDEALVDWTSPHPEGFPRQAKPGGQGGDEDEETDSDLTEQDLLELLTMLEDGEDEDMTDLSDDDSND